MKSALGPHGSADLAGIHREDDLLDRKEEVALGKLAEETRQIEERLGELRAELAAVEGSARRAAGVPVKAESEGSKNPKEKVALFRGRVDVFPVRWMNAKSGRTGYAPACRNKFVRGICELPRVKCGECCNQAFIPVSDQVILDHLQGRHVAGVYPMLEDETCWFLTADFDKEGWTDGHVAAFRETCQATGIRIGVERSRSGNSAHAWLFFSMPVPAVTARKLGCHLLTETMARRHQLSMESYDRLFPSQDRMPRGGFGNLIALPLQYGPREQGNTVFLDERMEPYQDQWAYLASVGRVAPATVDLLVYDATLRDAVLGVRSAGVDDEEGTAPWDRPPSGIRLPAKIDCPLSATVRVISAQRLFVEKAELPSALLNQIKRLAAFQNPEFYKRQRMRLSTALTPRVIDCSEELSNHLSLPRGCFHGLESLLGEHGVRVVIQDERQSGNPLYLHFQGELSPMQNEAAQAFLPHDTGVIVAPPGSGKTVLGAYLAAKRGCNTLILVHRRPLVIAALEERRRA